MKEAPLTIHNFGSHPRFWRHVVGWVVWIFVILGMHFSAPNELSEQADILDFIISSIMIMISTYSSFYFYERFYKTKKRLLFFLAHIPAFIIVAILGRLLTYWQGKDYVASIWTEISGLPILLLSIYLIKFIYHGIIDSIQLKQLKGEHIQTELNLLKTQLKPTFLIEKLKTIHTINLKDSEEANEEILTLADNLRQRLDKNNTTQSNGLFTEKIITKKQEIKPAKIKKHARVLRHLIVWVIFSLFINFNTWSSSNESWSTWNDTLLARLTLLWLYAFLIYISVYLYDKFIAQKRYWEYMISQILWLLGFVLLLFYARNLAVSLELIVTNASLLRALTGSIVVLTGAASVKASYHLAKESLSLNALKVKQTETQLKLLKSQVNPHFLFNILNNIYAKNLDDSQKANEYIEGLTSLLKYQSESQQRQFILLKEEVTIVENYINLEKIRLHNCKVITSKKGDFTTLRIIPLLLLPLVENAFKYGSGLEKGQINFYFEQTDNQFSFISKNRIVQNGKQRHSTGIGLDNVQKRLNIIYPKKHIFKTEIIDNTFIVTLNIAL